MANNPESLIFDKAEAMAQIQDLKELAGSPSRGNCRLGGSTQIKR
jgi:hypothetical protein